MEGDKIQRLKSFIIHASMRLCEVGSTHYQQTLLLTYASSR